MSLSLAERQAIKSRIAAWQKGRSPNGQYPVNVAEAVLLDDHLRPGDNYWTQYWAQFTGKEENGVDVVDWDYPETRPAYSQVNRWNLGWAFDCSSVWCIAEKTWFQKDIGTYTEGQYVTLPKLGAYKIPFEQRRIGDLHQYKFPGSTHPHVSHDSMQITDPKGGVGLIAHTTSASNPFRFQEDTYSRNYLVCTWRLPWFPYAEMFVVGRDYHLDMWHQDIYTIEYRIKAHMGAEVGGTPDGYYGPSLAQAMLGFQYVKGLRPTGAVDDATWNALAKDPEQAVLWMGCYHPDVGLMKNRLQAHGFGANLNMSHIYFGEKERYWLMEFQKAKLGKADGVCGSEATWPALLKAPEV